MPSYMGRRLAWLTLLLSACTRTVVEGGSNANDRSDGGEQGEQLLTGAMVISPDGKFVVAQRNQTSILLDVEAKSARELAEQVDRFVFTKEGDRGIAVLHDATLVSYDLATA